MRSLLSFLLLIALASCGPGSVPENDLEDAREVPLAYAQTFTIHQRDNYHIVDIEASLVSWGGAAEGPTQRARLVLVPREETLPPLTGDLDGATLIRTPVMRIAVNDQPHEAMLRALGVEDRIVAVGGHDSYDDTLRRQARSGAIAQIGYGWHMPPTLDALIGSEPDVLIARQADLTHTQHIDRIRELGIPVVPTFIDAEPHYLGRTEWIVLLGLLTGRESEAQSLVEEVSENVEKLKRLAKSQKQRSLLWAWFRGNERWAVTQRNAEAALIRDANALLMLEQPDDPRRAYFSDLSTETLLRSASGADCWVVGDPHSIKYPDKGVLSRFVAYRDGCMFHYSGRQHPEVDSFEIYEMGVIRPDWTLEDLMKILHPKLRDGDYRYFRSETWEETDLGASDH